MAKLFDLQAQLEAITSARNGGVVEVEYGDRKIRYRSLEAMDRIIADLTGQIAAIAGSGESPPPSVRRVTIFSSKGV